MRRRFPVCSDAKTAKHFFVLKGTRGSRYDTLYDSIDPVNLGDAPCCPHCGDSLGTLTWQPPYRVELEIYGDEPGDCARGPGFELLVSERFVEAFHEEGLTGLQGFHPAEVMKVRSMKKRARRSVSVPRYFIVLACFGRGAVDPVLNRVRLSKPITCMECRSTGIEAIHGFVLEPGTWAGEDIFRPRGMQGEIVVSERFKDFGERHGLTNMVLTATDRYVWDPSNLGPAPLPQT